MPLMEFDAVVEAAPGGGALVSLPAHAADFFGTRARFPVRATFNGVEYRGSTMPKGDGTFCLGITKAIRAAAGAGVGETVHVVVELDTAERTVEVPADLTAALAAAGPAATERFEGMSYTARKEYARWVAEAKRPETRRRRLGEAVERIVRGEKLS
jgi:hypothetical protein